MNRSCLAVCIVSSLLPPSYSQTQTAIPSAGIRASEHCPDSFAHIKRLAFDEKFQVLDEMRRHHPSCEQVYFNLRQYFLIHDRLAAGLKYFSDLDSPDSSCRNCQWMAARLFETTSEPDSANHYYMKALRSGDQPPPLTLLSDFVEFLVGHRDRYDASLLMERNARTPDYRVAAQLFYHYHQRQYSNVISEYRKLPSNTGKEPAILDALGKSYLCLENSASAEQVWRQGLQLAYDHKDRWFQALFLRNLGVSSYNQSDDDQALEFLRHAQSLAEDIDDWYLLQLIAGTTANVYYYGKAHYALAKDCYEESLAMSKRLRLTNDAIKGSLNLGQLLYERGLLSEAFVLLRGADSLSTSSFDDDMSAEAKQRMARIYLDLGHPETARQLCSEALALAGNRHKDLTERLFAVLADVKAAGKDYAGARAGYDRFIEYLESQGRNKEIHNYLSRIADTYKQEGRIAKAITYYDRALASAQSAEVGLYTGWHRFEIAKLSAPSKPADETIREYENVITIAAPDTVYELMTQAQMALGELRLRLGRRDAAIADFTKAAAIIERTRHGLQSDRLRLAYYEDRSSVYRKLSVALYQRYRERESAADLDSLLLYVQRTRGRTFHDVNDKLAIASPARGPLYERYLEACRLLSALERGYRESGQASPAFDEDISFARQLVIGLRSRLVEHVGGEASTLSVSAAIKELEDNGLGVIMYLLAEDSSFALVAANRTLKVVPLSVTSASVAAAIDSLVSPLHHASEDVLDKAVFYAAIAHRLYLELFEPIAAAMPLPQRLLIIPDLAMLRLPFEMLLTKPPIQPTFTPMAPPVYVSDFLVQQYCLAYSPSLTVSSFQRDTRRDGKKLLIAANPRGTALDRFAPLPFAEAEADKIKTRYDDAVILRGEAATTGNFLTEAKDASCILFAGHASPDSVYDEFSRLVLAIGDDQDDDGFLMGYEIAAAQWQCDLIALSACETAVGRVVAGEGTLGIPRTLLSAGAGSVLMTLWQVDDQFSAEIMPAFCDYYLEPQFAHFYKKFSKVEALAMAKRKTLRNAKMNAQGYYRQHPLFWAPYVLYGDPGVSVSLFERMMAPFQTD